MLRLVEVEGQHATAVGGDEETYVYSSGIPAHKAASAATADEAHNADGPGFSVLVLDDAFNVVAAADFNTHASDTALPERRPWERPSDRLTEDR